jgi:hypothetical protein
MVRHHIQLLIATLLFASPALTFAQNGPTTQDVDAEAARALRTELARTKLEVQKLRTQLQDIQQFLAEQDIEKTLAEWRSEREALAEQRRQIQQERVRLNEERRRLQQLMTRVVREEAEQQQQQVDAAGPRWDARYQMGLIDKDQQVIYVRSYDGVTLVDTYPSIDRKNVKVRGTFQNKSTQPWRYTFEIRIGSDEKNQNTGRRRVIGSWLYQTPVMGANDLHEWEVTVPVTDVAYIEVVQIGNVKADRPAPGPAPAPGTAPSENEPAPQSSVSGTATTTTP